jgi:hypothetical protein
MHLGEACGITHNLRGLAASSVSERTEVRHVVDTWLTWPTAYVAAHVPTPGKSLYPHIEGVRRRYIGEGLAGDTLVEASGITHHLGKLPSGDRVVRTEGTIRIT